MPTDWFNDPDSYKSASSSQPVTPRVDWFNDPDSYKAAPTDEGDKGPDTYHDYADALYSGLHGGIGATAASLMSTITRPEFSKYWLAQAQRERDLSQQDTQDMSPAAQQSINASLISKDFWRHPIRALGLQTTQQLPTIAALGLGTATGGIAGGAGTYAAINAGGAISDFAQTIKQTPTEDLAKNPSFASDLQYMSADDARTKLIQERAGPLAVKAGIVGGIAGLTLDAPLVSKAMTGPVGLVVAGGVEAGGVLGIAGGTTEALTQQASGQPLDTGEILKGTIGQAATGAVLGGLGGLRGQEGVPSKGITHPIPGRGKLSPEAEPGEFKSVGSPRQGRKPEGQEKPEKNVPSQPVGTGEAPAPSILSTDQELALTQGVKPKPPPIPQPTPVESTEPISGMRTEGEQTPPLEKPSVPVSPPPLEGEGPLTPEPKPPVAPYQPTLEPHPAATAVDPRAYPSQPSTAAVPERPETLQLQQEALANAQKELVFYPGGKGYSEGNTKLLRDQPNIKTIRWPNKDIAIFRTDGPQELTPVKVRSAVKDGKLNELLGLGSTTREEAQARVAAGERPAAVVERTPDGTEARAAAATDQTAPAQIQSLEQTKLSPENTVGVETPAQVIAERLTAPPQTGRILPAIETPVEKAKLAIARRKEATQIQKRAAKELLEPKKEITPGGKHWTREELERISRNNIIADKIMEDHEPSQREGLTDIYRRAKQMVAMAKAHSVSIPDELGGHYSAGTMLLSEAKTLISKEFPKPDAYARFIDREALLRKGKKDEVLGIRKSEAEPGLGAPEISEQPTETTPESELLEKEREAELEKPKVSPFTVEKVKHRTPTPEKLAELRKQLEVRAKKESPTAAMIRAGNYEKGHIRLEGEDISIETGKGEQRQPWPTKVAAHYGYIRGTLGKDGDHIDTYIGPKGETGKIFVMNQLGRGGIFDEHKVFMGFETKDQALNAYYRSFDNPTAAWKRVGGVVELNKDEFKDWLDNGDKFQPISQGLEGRSPDNTVETNNMSNKNVRATYLGHGTVSQALDRVVNTKIYSQSMRPVMNKLLSKLKELVGDVPVYLLSDQEMSKLIGEGADGFYNSVHNHIMLNMEIPDERITHTLVHEVFHAATKHALDNDPHLAELSQKLYKEVKGATFAFMNRPGDIQHELRYGLTSPLELLTEISSNPVWQDTLKKFPISQELARELDMPRWRRATLFQGALDWFRKMLGLSPREYSAIEAALNIGERAMWAKEVADEYGYRLRASQVSMSDLQSEGPTSALIRPRTYSHDLMSMPEKVKDSIIDLGKRSGFKDIVREQGKRFLPMMDMVYGNEKYFGPQTEENNLRQLGHEAIKMDGKRVTIKQQSDNLLSRVKDAVRQIPNEINDLYSLLQKSDFYNVHPDEPLGIGRNKSIKVNKTNIENSNKDHWEAIAHHEELSENYNNLSPLGKTLFHGIRSMLEGINKAIIAGTQKRVFAAAMEELNRSDRPDAAEIKEVLRKVNEGEELGPDEEKTYKDDPIVKSLRAAGTMFKRQGFYFPAKRFGKYVVTGTHAYDIPATGVRDPKNPNEIIFSSRKDAFNFTRSLDLPSQREIKYFYPRSDGTKNYVSRGESHVTMGAPQEEYHVIVNPKHVEFMDSTYEGEKIAKALRDAGVQDVTEPVLRQQNQYLDYSLHSGQVDAFDKALDRMQHVTPGVREAAKEAIHYMAITSMQGNRINKSFLRKYRVAGADSDLLRTLDSYRSSAATYLAGQEHLPKINQLLDGVRDQAERARQTNSDHAKDMVSVVQEMETRLLNFKQGSYGELSRSFFHNVAVLALWKYLFSPAHFALHMMHPVITSIPEMSSQHGWGPTYRAMISAYNDMGAGQNLLLGGKSFMQKAWDFTKDPTDFIDSLRTQLQKSGRSAATINMLKELENDGYLTHMGLDFSQFYQKSGGLTYMADRSLSLIQELNNATESVNRVGTATAAFDLAKNKGLSDKEATGYAKQVLSQTHGLYSNINRSPVMMSHPIVRSMLQFKTFPMMIYRILARNVYHIYKNDTPGVRWQAIKALSGMVGTAALFTGAQGATPEPIRLAITMTNLMGLTNSWTEEEDKLRRTLAETFSPEISGVVMGGLSHELGWNLQHRMGLNSLTVFAEPRTTSPQDVENWLTNAILGVPWGLGIDAYTGYQNLSNGDYGKAVNLMLPKALADLNKAYQLGTEGKSTPRGNILVPDVGAMGLLGQALGFVPDKVSEAQQARAAYGDEQAEQRAEKERVIQLWHSGDRAAAIHAMHEFNDKYPRDRLNLSHIRQAQTILGYSATRRNRQELEEREHDYGLQ